MVFSKNHLHPLVVLPGACVNFAHHCLHFGARGVSRQVCRQPLHLCFASCKVFVFVLLDLFKPLHHLWQVVQVLLDCLRVFFNTAKFFHGVARNRHFFPAHLFNHFIKCLHAAVILAHLVLMLGFKRLQHDKVFT